MRGFIKQIRMYPYGRVPRGWLPCDGRRLPLGDYSALFHVIGTSYGGNGETEVVLPNLVGLFPVGSGRRPGGAERRHGEEAGRSRSRSRPRTCRREPSGPRRHRRPRRRDRGQRRQGLLRERCRQRFAARRAHAVRNGRGPRQPAALPRPAFLHLRPRGFPAAGGSMIGQITLFGGGFVPQGHLPCDGRKLKIAEHPELHRILGYAFGGDGQQRLRPARPARPHGARQRPRPPARPGGRRRNLLPDRRPDPGPPAPPAARPAGQRNLAARRLPHRRLGHRRGRGPPSPPARSGSAAAASRTRTCRLSWPCST